MSRGGPTYFVALLFFSFFIECKFHSKLQAQNACGTDKPSYLLIGFYDLTIGILLFHHQAFFFSFRGHYLHKEDNLKGGTWSEWWSITIWSGKSLMTWSPKPTRKNRNTTEEQQCGGVTRPVCCWSFVKSFVAIRCVTNNRDQCISESTIIDCCDCDCCE